MKEAQALPVHLPGNAELADGTPGSTPPPALPGESTIPTETIVDPTAAGVSQNGVIFVVGRFGTLGRCSGTSVNAPNLSLVITAGHCVHEGRHWMGTKWVFVPGYHYGERPFGTFVAKWLGSTPQWLKSENSNYDVGAAVVSRNERGERLADAVGADEIAWGLSPKQVFDVYGYPVAEPFDGATLQHCGQTPYEGHAFFSLLTPGPLNLAFTVKSAPGLPAVAGPSTATSSTASPPMATPATTPTTVPTSAKRSASCTAGRRRSSETTSASSRASSALPSPPRSCWQCRRPRWPGMGLTSSFSSPPVTVTR